MTQVQLARKIGIKQASLSNLETDRSRKPAAATLLKAAAVLEANADWILTGDGDPFTAPRPTKADEQDLLDRFQRMTRDQQQALLATAKAFTP